MSEPFKLCLSPILIRDCLFRSFLLLLADGTSISYTGDGGRRGTAREQAAYHYLVTHGFRTREPLEAENPEPALEPQERFGLGEYSEVTRKPPSPDIAEGV